MTQGIREIRKAPREYAGDRKPYGDTGIHVLRILLDMR
jgi:hypothetical protein